MKISWAVENFASLIIIILFPLALALTLLIILITDSTIYLKMLPQASLETNQLVAVSINIHSYLVKGTPLKPTSLSTQAFSHLSDVRVLMSKTKIFIFSTTILLVLSVIVLVKIKSRKIIKSFYTGAKLLVASTLIISILAFTLFEQVFILFHKVAFRNNLWLFPENDRLIKLFPQQFFQNYFILYLITLFIVGLTVSLLLKNLLRND